MAAPGVLVAPAWPPPVGRCPGPLPCQMEEGAGHKHFVSVSKCNCLPVYSGITVPNCPSEEVQIFLGLMVFVWV